MAGEHLKNGRPQVDFRRLIDVYRTSNVPLWRRLWVDF